MTRKGLKGDKDRKKKNKKRGKRIIAGAGGQNMDIHTNIHPCLEGFQRARDLPRRGRDPPPGRGQQEAQHRRRRRQPGRSPFKVGYLIIGAYKVPYPPSRGGGVGFKFVGKNIK